MIRLKVTKSDPDWKEAKKLDESFMKESFRNDFLMPRDDLGHEFVYVCGNSLGPQPVAFKHMIDAESDIWAKYAVAGHLHNPTGNNWVDWDSLLLDDFAVMVGAAETDELCVNSTLTTNLQNLLVFFYRPTKERFKIITDSNSFPSDYLVLESQVQLHGFKKEDALVEVQSDNDFIIRDDDIIAAIEKHGSSTALVMISGVHYLTGQVFDMPRIVEAAHKAGCLVGFDLAHAIGNVPLKLSEWKVDFAVWCTYKYLNSGPGSTGGFFINRIHHDSIAKRESNILAGWWGVDLDKRFLMKHEFEGYRGARAFQQSCTSIFNTCGVLASMETFRKTSVEKVLERSHVLTNYFRRLFKDSKINARIITPIETARSGAQISISFASREEAIDAFDRLSQLGVIVDRREPTIIRFTFTGLYNSHEDVYLTIQALKSQNIANSQ